MRPAPAIVDGRRMAETRRGSGRSPASAVTRLGAAIAKPFSFILSYSHNHLIAMDTRYCCFKRKLRRKLVYRPAALKARRGR